MTENYISTRNKLLHICPITAYPLQVEILPPCSETPRISNSPTLSTVCIGSILTVHTPFPPIAVPL
jgi:hypothetical protein